MTRKTLASCIIIMGVGFLAAHAAHALRIDDLKHHYCHWAWDRTAEFRVVDFGGHCAEADVLLIDDGVVLRSQRVAQGEESSMVLDGADGYFELRATCGGVRASAYAHADREGGAPTFSRIVFASGSRRWAKDPAVFELRGVRDAGEWHRRDFRVTTTVDGDPATRTTRRGLGANLGNLAAGAHTVRVQLRDSCGRHSSEVFEFNVDDTDPTVFFIRPRNFETVHLGDVLSVEIAAGDPGGLPVDFDTVSGLRSVRLYLDAIPGEFSTGVELCRFPGPWMIGFSNRSICSTQPDLTPGFHKLIAVAEDRVGNTGYAERFIFVGP